MCSVPNFVLVAGCYIDQPINYIQFQLASYAAFGRSTQSIGQKMTDGVSGCVPCHLAWNLSRLGEMV